MPRKTTSSTSSTSTAAALAPSKVTSIESKSAAPTQATADATSNAGFNVEERIRWRAYELYEQRGRHDGAADQDWLRAEAELRVAAGKRSA